MSSSSWRQRTDTGNTPYWGERDGESWPVWSSVAPPPPQTSDGAAVQLPERTTPLVEGSVSEPAFQTSARSSNQWGDWTWGQPWSSGAWGNGAWRGDDWQRWGQWNNGGGGTSKGDYSDPPAWGGWGSYRLWKKALRRWDANTDVPVWRRFEKLCKQLDWDLQGRFEHVPEQVLGSPGYLDAVLNILDVIAGEKNATEKRRVVRAALFEGQRRKEETLSQFALRREQEFLGADRYLTIPSELKAFIIEETAGLSRQDVQNLRTVDFDKVVNALKMLDVEEEPITRGKSSLFAGVADTENDDAEDDDDSSEDEISLLLYEDEVEAFLTSVDGVDEKEAVAMLAAWDKEQREDSDKRKTWKANKDRKMAAKKDRRVFKKKAWPRLSIADLKEVTKCANCGQKGHWKDECPNPFKAKDPKGSPPGKRAISFVYLGVNDEEGRDAGFVGGACWSGGTANTHLDDEIEGPISRKNGFLPVHTVEPYDPITHEHEDTILHEACVTKLPSDELYDTNPFEHGDTIPRKIGVGELSHDELYGTIPRKIDLPKPFRPQKSDPFQCTKTGCHWSGAVLLDHSLRTLIEETHRHATSNLVFLTLDPGHAILDIGAGQDLIGRESYEPLSERLRQQGLQCIRLAGDPPAAHGVGGQANPLFQALIPCILGGVPGVIRATVVKENVPQLLSEGLLEATGANINMRTNVITYQELGATEPMLRRWSGHRVVDIARWDGGSFPVPSPLKAEFKLQ